MSLSLNTLRLCRQILGQQSLSVNASRDEITAVLDARDEIDAAIGEAEAPPPGPRPPRVEGNVAWGAE